MTEPVILERPGLVPGRVVRRYQRFLCDVELDAGERVTAHCTNTGTMASCWAPGDRVLLEPNDNPRRRLRFTWIACQRDGCWVGVDTGTPNRVVAEAARRDLLPGIRGLRTVRTEVRYGRERSRIDVLAEDRGDREVYLEVKNTTLRVDGPVAPMACFPDAVTARGAKHLRELTAMVEEGHRAAVVFFVHRGDVVAFDVAREVDPGYAAELERAVAAGVGVLPLAVRLHVREDPDGTFTVSWSLPGLLPWRRRDAPGSRSSV